jgi:hypothetical protein
LSYIPWSCSLIPLNPLSQWQLPRIALIFAALFFLLSKAEGEILEEYPSPGEMLPLYAGTQLAFYPVNAAPGHISVQPFLSYVQKRGIYESNWSFSREKNINQAEVFVALETGITKSLDISLFVNGIYTESRGHGYYRYGDTEMYLGWQILHDQKGKWVPDLRLLVGESFPTGKYDRLSPAAGGGDSSGGGAYETKFLLVIAKTFYPFPEHPFNLNLNLFYILSSNVGIDGISIFGGTEITKGTIRSGDQYIGNFAAEYSLNRYWALGIDVHYIHQNRSTFRPKKDASSLNLHSREQLSLAPCLEYSWSENGSIALGPWFTVLGRNSVNFFNLVANVYVYF